MLGALIVMPAHRKRRCHTAAGVTLVELMVTLAIMAVLVMIALPSMRDLIARKRVEGIAWELMTDLRLLRSHQIQNRLDNGTGINFETTDAKSCYVLYARGNGGGGNPINCNCKADAATMCGAAGLGGIRPTPFRQVDIPVSSGVSVVANRRFLAMLGYNAMPQTDATLEVSVSSQSAGEIRVSTNAVGMPSMCSVSGSFGSITRCPP